MASSSFARVCGVACVWWLITVRADAQMCHAPVLRDPAESGFRVSVAYAHAWFDDVTRGDYLGLTGALAWHNPWLFTEIALPLYRIFDAGDEQIGLGDLALDARLALLRDDAGSYAAGIELAMSLPTGDADHELGMGHAMGMPGLWARLDAGGFAALVQVAYGVALGEHEHGNHADAGGGHAGHDHADAVAARATPRVNPMNTSEFEHAVSVSYLVHPAAALQLRWLGAVPFEDEGFGRQVVAPGLVLNAGNVDAALEVQVPVAGDPFDFKLQVALGARL